MNGNSAFAAMRRDYSIAMDMRTSPNGMGATTVTIKRRTRNETPQGGSTILDVLIAEDVPVQYDVPRPAQLARAEQQAGGKLIATVIVAFTMPTEIDGVELDITADCFLIVKPGGKEKEKTFFVRGFDVGSGPSMTVIATAEE